VHENAVAHAKSLADHGKKSTVGRTCARFCAIEGIVRGHAALNPAQPLEVFRNVEFWRKGGPPFEGVSWCSLVMMAKAKPFEKLDKSDFRVRLGCFR
jgi:hypothetical protein